jgi:putative aldouronate transport system substrate-binding protein
MTKKILGMFLVTTMMIFIVGCNGGGTLTNSSGLDYGENQNLDADINSWEQIDSDDADIEIDWWVDATNWDFYQISSLVYKKTGVKINFTTALNSDGSELSTMIAGGRLPDVITITDYSTRAQLAEEGYVYSLTKLSEFYAPSLRTRMSDELQNYYSASDGEVYGLANNFYNDEDIAEYQETGNSVLSNYSIVVREDYLNAYIAYKHSVDSNFDENVETTTPSGFIEMCNWVKDTYGLSNANPTVVLSEFLAKASNGSISTALSGLMEYFSVPKEDSEGNLVYEYATDEFKEVLLFLNQMYQDKLIISSNFGYSATNIITNIKNGYPFAVIGAIQNYSMGFANRSAAGYNGADETFSDSHEYVPIVITNEAGEAPVLLDMTGRGLRVSMITNNCERIDRVIKVFDYLVSEQGQRECYYGEVEGQYFNYLVRPNESETITVDGQSIEHVYKYGQIQWTSAAKYLLGASNNSGWYNAGIKQISILQNPLYVSMTSVYGAEMDTFQFYVRYNQKAALIPYTYSRLAFKYPVDTSNIKTYNDMIDVQASLEKVWIDYLPSIIMAPNAETALSLYETALAKAETKGYVSWLEYQNASYQANKLTMGIEYGWIKNDPSYVEPEVYLIGFKDEYYIPVPEYINISE